MSLNAHQQRVIDSMAQGPIVIEAVPGSGKTYTLENLVAALINSGIDPLRLGVFTFAKKAAAEARRRIARAIFPGITEAELDFFEEPYGEDRNVLDGGIIADRKWIESDPKRQFLADWVCTIHAASFRLLKAAGYELKVLSGHHQWEVDTIIKDGLKELDWEESPKSVKHWISKAILALVEPRDAREWYAVQLDLLDGPVYQAGNLAELYKRYYDYLKQHNLVDFDMMTAKCIYLLRTDKKFRAMVSDLFDYTITDEGQDTDSNQFEILSALAEKSGNLTIVGDVDQAMYSFRGAQPGVLREDFAARWPNVKRYNLPTNYRSTKAIVNASAQLITSNYTGADDPYLKPFQARDDAPDGEALTYTESDTFADMCAEIINSVKESEAPGDWFVLSRTRAECAAIHLEFLAAGIPAVNKSGGLVFQAPHIKKVLAYAALACNHHDARDDMDVLNEIANVASKDFRAPMTRRRHVANCHAKPWENCGCPIVVEEGKDYTAARYYGKEAVADARNWDGIVRQQYETNRGRFPTVRAKGAMDLVSFVGRVERIQNDSHAAIRMIIDDCVLPWLQAEEGLTDEDLAENGKQEAFDLLVNMAAPDKTLEQYLVDIENLGAGDKGDTNDTGKVIIGTIHFSKGAEKKYVALNTTRLPIVPPVQKPGLLPTGKPPTIQEERRLAYVGASRGKEVVKLFGALEWNNKEADTSQFVYELGLAPEIVDIETI